MHALKTLQARMRARADSEHEQAFLRIVIVGLVLGYMAVFHGWRNNWTPLDLEIVRVLSGFLLLAVAIFIAICVHPQPNIPRRLVGMVADAGGCTWYMCVAGEYGFFVIGIYLFITFGNGFRYGRRYLFGCQALCLLGLGGTLAFVPFWVDRRVEGVGLLIALVVLPLYVSTLLKRIQEARAKAEEANNAKTSFLANMSHEIRTPLNGIVGVVDLFKTTELTEHQQELVQLLRHSTMVLRSLVDDVLDISKIESGRLAIEVATFDLHASINGLLQLLRPHAASKGLTLHAVVDPELDYCLKGDSHHLRQILLNLLGNAIKFTERGEIVLSVTLAKATELGVTARFEVRDTGIGIPPELLPRIFERFVQVDQSATRRFGGSGLGTTIAKQLVELMGGTIGVNSRLGDGTTFWFELPLLRDADMADADAKPKEALLPTDEPTMLIADSGVVQSLTTALVAAGERVECVAPGDSFSARLDALTSTGVRVRAVVASCSVELACSAFAATRQRLGEQPIALIYVANKSLSVVDSARIKSIREAVVIDGSPTPRIFANAIHAAVATGGRDANDAIDLSQLLKQRRTSLRILVADDNPTNQAIISKLLGSAGHTILLASDGDEALDLYEAESPDIALLDFNMPGRNGLEVIQAIRIMEVPGTRIPAIILSASVTPEARSRAMEAGADDFVGKPFDAVSLITKVDKLACRVRPAESRGGPTRTKTPNWMPRTNAYGSAQQSNRPVLSYERLSEIEDIARDSQFTMELLRGFRADVVSLLKRLDAVANKESGESIGDILHALKGAAVGVGALQLADACKDQSLLDEIDKTVAVQLIRASATTTFEHLDDYVRHQHHVAL